MNRWQNNYISILQVFEENVTQSMDCINVISDILVTSQDFMRNEKVT